MLLVTRKGPVLNLRDANGNPCVMLGADKDGSGMLLYDGDGKRRFMLATREQVMLGMFDVNGKPIWRAP